MNNKDKNGILQNIPSGIVVFLVALPLCMGIALASGAPPLAGIISGIIGGIVVGALSTSHISVSGPAAGLTAIVLGGITDLGSFELFLVAGFIAGILQIILGFLRAGSVSSYFPNNVIEGMLAGIGLIIIIKQLPYAFGIDESTATAGGTIVQQFLNSISPGVVIVTAVSLAILLLWEKVAVLKKIKLLPGALVAVLAGITLSEIFKGTSLAIPTSQFVAIATPDTLAEYKNLIVFPDFSGFLNYKVWILGATIAVIASIETLLCIEATDRIDPYKRIADSNVELKAQGIGNIVSSLIGGLPITSVIVRSSTNVNAGATKKYSAIVHGILLLVSVMAIPHLLNRIPLGTLAAVLLIVGYKLASPAKIKHVWQKGKFQFIPFVVTFVCVLVFDLLIGVIVGLAVAILFLLLGNMKRAYYLSREELNDAQVVRIDLAEEVSFLNKAAIKKTLKNIKAKSKVIINARKSSYISGDILELIEEFTNFRAKEDDIEVVLVGFKKIDYSSLDQQPQRVEVKYRRTI